MFRKHTLNPRVSMLSSDKKINFCNIFKLTKITKNTVKALILLNYIKNSLKNVYIPKIDLCKQFKIDGYYVYF